MQKAAVPRWIRVADYAFALTVSCPLVSLLWWGGFSLTDRFVYQNSKPFGFWLSFIFGSVVLQNAHVVGDTLLRFSEKSHATGHLLHRLASSLLMTAIILQWDGLWSLLDFYMGHTVISCVVCWLIGTTVLVLANAHNNVVTGVPYILRHDGSRSIFDIDSCFKEKYSGNRLMSFLDHAFTVFVVQPAIIFIWRAVWNVQDYSLFPADPEFSANISCFAGTLVTVLQFCVQSFMTKWAGQLNANVRFAMEFVWRQLAVCSSVTLWRGQWVWFSIWIDNDYATCLATITSAFVLLTLNLGGLSFQLGAVPDSSLQSPADRIRFQIDYFSLIWQEQSQQWPTKMVITSTSESKAPYEKNEPVKQHSVYELSSPQASS